MEVRIAIKKHNVNKEICQSLVSFIETATRDDIVSLKPFYKCGRKTIEVKKRFGYSPYDLRSALQKDIRRGNEYEALFWAVKLESLGNKSVIKGIWNRLKVIASEDIGSANPTMPLVIETLEKQYYDAWERKNDSFRLFLANAVVNLARSEKSRIVDDIVHLVYHEIQHEDKKLPIPDYAYDMHTSRGKRMGRGLNHFFGEGCKLVNEILKNPYTEKARKMTEKYGRLQSPFKRKKKVN
jgi:replication-associated recombination protein RarA